MFLAEILGFWLLIGAVLFGVRRLQNAKESQVPRVLPPLNGRHA